MINRADAKHRLNELHADRSKQRKSRLIITQKNDEILKKLADGSSSTHLPKSSRRKAVEVE
jgi:hypothetical protein